MPERIYFVGTGECGGCNWDECELYVVAKSEEEAKRLYREGEAGLCAHCIVSLLIEHNAEITFPSRR